MSLLGDLYNLIAQRNLGQLLGMKWEPDRDIRHQRERFMKHVTGQLELLNVAKGLLQNGDIRGAGATAYSTFALFPFAIVPELVEAHELANEIIAGLPEDYAPPQFPPIVQRRIPADRVVARMAEAKKLAAEGKHRDALALLHNDTMAGHIFTHGDAHMIDVQWDLPGLCNDIRDLLERAANEA